MQQWSVVSELMMVAIIFLSNDQLINKVLSFLCNQL